MPSYIDALDDVIRNVIAPSAQEVDTTGSFPSAGVAALGINARANVGQHDGQVENSLVACFKARFGSEGAIVARGGVR